MHLRPRTILSILSLSLLPGACDRGHVVEDEIRDCADALSGWELHTGTFPKIQKQRDLFFPSERIGYCVGNSGTISKTEDGGISWTLQEHYILPGNPTNPDALTRAHLNTVYFTDELTGYAGGEGEQNFIQQTDTPGVLLSTTDGGETWSKRYLDSIDTINDLHFFDRQNGTGLFYDSGRNRGVYITHDGGETWQRQSLAVDKIESYQFTESPTRIYLMGSTSDWQRHILSSSDGINWEVRSAPESNCHRIYFVDDNIGYIFCGETYQTRDAGNTWEAVESPMHISSLMHFSSAEEGFIINGTYIAVQSGWETFAQLTGYEVFQTTDGGNQWTLTKTSKDCDFDGLSFSPSRHTFVTINYGVNVFEE